MKLAKLFVLSIAMISITAKAGTNDVTGSDGFIRVTLSQDKKSTSFELCLKSHSSCVALGGRSDFLNIRQIQNPLFFSLEKLREQRSNQYLQTTLAVVGDIIGGVVLVGGGAAAAGWAYGTYGAITTMAGGALNVVIGGIAGGVSGGAATIYLANTIDHLNPAEQNREASILEDSVITDKDLTLNHSILADAESLNKVLLKVKPE